MQSKKTHEQFRRVIQKQVNTKNGPEDLGPGESLSEAQRNLPQAPDLFDIRTGDRSIKRGAHQESEHNKHRSDKH
jgi:hypothetical protein